MFELLGELDGNGYTEHEAIMLTIDKVLVDAVKERLSTIVSNEDNLKKLLELMRPMSERERRCFFMHEVCLLSMSVIAERLGIKKRTVQQYIQRARKKVKGDSNAS